LARGGPVAFVQAGITRDRGEFADVRDRGRRIQRAVAVDDEARIILLDQRRAKRVRQKPAETGNADIPGDVPLAFRLGKPKRPSARGMRLPA